MRKVILLLLLVSASAIAQTSISNFIITRDGIRINYEVAGLGKPVILVHGFMNTLENWKRTALYETLLKSGYQVITLDLRGSGKSEKPHDCDQYGHDAEAKDIMQLADHLQLQKYSIVGYSRGSIITARVLVLDKRVSKAVMGGMGLDFTNPQWPRRIMFYRALNNEDVPELKDFIKRVKESDQDQVALACQQKEQPSTSLEELKRIRKRVLVICGDQDSDNGSAQSLAAAIPKSVFVTVPGVHNDTARSDKFAAEVFNFLNLK